MADYTGEFQMFGSLINGEKIGKTHISFRNKDDYEQKNTISDDDYDPKGVIFKGYFYKTDTSVFSVI